MFLGVFRQSLRKYFYIFSFLSIIVLLNIYFNRQMVERFLSFREEKEFKYQDIAFKIPKDFPLPICADNQERGSIIFYEQFHPGRYNWYLGIYWDKGDFDWKGRLPELKKTSEGKFRPEYIFGQEYEKQIKLPGRLEKYKLIYMWIRRSCGTEDENRLLLYEFFDSKKERYLKVINFSDGVNKKLEKKFRRFIISLKVEE